MEEYGLYHTLNSNLKKGDISKKEKSELLAKASSLDLDGSKAFIKLIFAHSKQENDGVLQDIPYCIEQQGNDVDFNLTKIPIQLRRILLKFVRIASNIDV